MARLAKVTNGERFVFGSGYTSRYACGSWNLNSYYYATCDVTVTDDENAVVGLVETK